MTSTNHSSRTHTNIDHGHSEESGRADSNYLPTIATAAPLAPVTSDHTPDSDYPVSGGHNTSSSTLTDEDQQAHTEKQWQHDHTKLTQSSNLNEKQLHDLQRTPTSTSASSISTNHNHDLETTISRVSTDARGNTYPEGGKEAYLVVFGSFCGCLISLGLMNTLSTYTAYVSTHQLADLPTSTVGWIFGIYAFLSFFCGLQVGPLFDAFGPRWLVLAGSVLILLTYILLAECTKYWHFILVFSVLGGTGTSLVFTPSIAAVGHWFYTRRGTFTGVACVGGSLGGIIFPLTLQALFDIPGIGWPWSQRILALINLPLAICANVFTRSRLPAQRSIKKEQILPDARVFKDKTFALVTLGVFFVEWGLFVPISYLGEFALSIRIDGQFSYQLIAIFNAGSCLGRWLPGLVADRIGRFNAMILTTMICWLGAFAFWLPSELLASTSQTARLALLIVFSVIFGFGSGAGISLVPVCVGQLCRTEEYGRYYATCYTVVSFATLTGIPLAGSLLIHEGSRERFWGLVLFTALSYVVSTAVLIGAKVTKVGWGRDLIMRKF